MSSLPPGSQVVTASTGNHGAGVAKASLLFDQKVKVFIPSTTTAQKKEKLIKLGDRAYAPEKWSVKDIIQHLIDAERIFTYRALRFARNDSTALPGFEENEYAPAAQGNKRSIDDLLSEFRALRGSTLDLFESFDKEMLEKVGKASGVDISVLAIGFAIVGHTRHHVNVIREKYFPLIEN